MERKIVIRPIQPEDNEAVCHIIRTVLEEYGGKIPGTAYYDKDTEQMYQAYQKPRAAYFVAEVDGKVVGGCGVQHLNGTDKNIAELQKLYVLKEYRGLGLGKKLVDKSIEFAKQAGYEAIYLETFENMIEAQNLYKKFGFRHIDYRLGGTGHYSCPVWMLLTFND